jgi:hypothetical protein
MPTSRNFDLTFNCILITQEALLIHADILDITNKYLYYTDVERHVYTVTKSEPNEASLWKVTLQKRENYHVDAGTFIPPLTRFYTLFCAGKVFPYMDGDILPV